ncbi:hypothetical protein C8A05DRAFT_44983 [Staphylotrichum tortipilum]|uniref:LysM domain-containing protein n=1 Tax=Staphylotrichum tortipilum TaxID=2831512 RepID=A0AAN6MI83_9PEZI|nr:hypothetical protein C8A05DRAFT_44983 [Staphylotrichum longicolle]
MLLPLAFLVFFLTAARGEIVLFPWTDTDGTFGNAVDADTGFGNSAPISATCASALNQTVACDPQMQLLAASGYVISLDSSNSGLCDAACNASLVAYRNAVTAACGVSGAFDTYDNTWRGDIIYDYFNMVCDKDPVAGEYCPKWLKEQYAANGNPTLESLPDSVLCSHCQINNMRTVQSSVFLGYNEAMVESYRRPPPQETFPNTANGDIRTCISGNTYITQSADTCHSIALAKSVAENTLASINDLGVDCTRLTLESDTRFTLCLPQTCTTAQTTASDDCWSISAQHNISFPQFKAFNPSLNSDCTNLRPGAVVCVSSPDGSYVPTPLPGSNSSWTLGEYANSLVPAPGITPFGTTDQCGGYYQVQPADTCRRISLAAKVSIPLFREVNPSVDTDCTNLVPGLWYCVHPTYDWNITAGDDDSGGPTSTSSTTISAPGPTPTGTTQECYKWHLVVSGDNCALLQNTLGVTTPQLVAWNPDLNADCSNLKLGTAYCIQGPPIPSPTTTTTATSTTTSSILPPTTSSSSSSSPHHASGSTYTVVAGDWCARIWEEFNLTEAEFRGLNPGLGADCGIQVGERVCVA